jgi:predicted nucleotidyltransferase component of viral defense system
VIQKNAIIEWKNTVPWLDARFVEQDMVISRAVIEIFQDEFLREKLAFRGGTAIYKLFLPPVRYSEDIDLVQTKAEPIGPVLDRIRKVLTFLGEPKTKRKMSNNTLMYRFEAEEPRGVVLRLKIEINGKEHFSVFGHEICSFEMKNQWFAGKCDIRTYCLNELIGTKIRALYQRKKGRDLFDLYYVLKNGNLNVNKAVECYRNYIAFSGHHVPTADEYEANLEDKMSDVDFRADTAPLLSPEIYYDIDEAYETVVSQIIEAMR